MKSLLQTINESLKESDFPKKLKVVNDLYMVDSKMKSNNPNSTNMTWTAKVSTKEFGFIEKNTILTFESIYKTVAEYSLDTDSSGAEFEKEEISELIKKGLLKEI